MYPESLFHIGEVGVNLYVASYLVGFIPALIVLLYLSRERKIEIKRAVDGWMAGVAFFLAYMFFVAPHRENPWALAFVFTGLILVIAGIASYAWRNPGPNRFMERVDILFPPLALYAVFARFGCFCAGCCHGKPAFGLPWAVVFDHPQTACIYKGIPVHPTQLYLLCCHLILFCFLMRIRNNKDFAGAMMWVYLFGYGLIRFFIEFFRGDPRAFAGPLAENQWICIGFMVLGAVMLFHRFYSRPLVSKGLQGSYPRISGNGLKGQKA